jgi:predicted metal-dependent phosphoesterase TrpH
MRIPIREYTAAQERSCALIINRQWRASMNEHPAFEEFNKAVDEVAELNTYKPAHERKTLADHPVVQMGDAAAKSVEAAADAVVEEAQALKTACSDFADDLRRGAKEIADRATHILKKIHAAGKELQTARENYLNGLHLSGDDTGTSQMPPQLPPGRQPGAVTEERPDRP